MCIRDRYEYIKTKRRVTGVRFLIFDKIKRSSSKNKEGGGEDKKGYAPSEAELDILTFAQRNAYDNLVKFGVYEGIAFKNILPNLKGGDIEGFEDYFIKHALAHFKRWARQQTSKEISAATFVKWWNEADVFSHNQDVFWKIVEKVNKDKKKIDQTTLDNLSLIHISEPTRPY